MVDVIVVGGGPVGLMTAALLDSAGVRVEVYERNPEPSQQYRGTTMHPRTLEVLTVLESSDGRRLSDVLLEQGKTLSHAHFAALPAMLDYRDLPTPFPFVLMLPQWRTSAALADTLLGRGVPVHYGAEVTDVEQSADEVRVRIGDTVRTARFVVGADGAHSAVRKAAGINFPGTEPSLVGFVGDVQMTETAPRSVWNAEAGYVGIVPLTETATRIFGVQSHHSSLKSEEVRRIRSDPFTLDELRSALRRICGTDFGVHSPSWISTASNPSGHATRYREGRMILVGDAAHVHLPAGGQGLNVGLQDATNLAWKLAAEIHCWAPARLVSGDASYDAERRPIAAKLVANTQAQDALMHTFSPAGEAMRELFSSYIARGGEVAADLAGWLSGLGHSYLRPDGAHPLVGTRAPNLALESGSLLRALHPGRFLLVDLLDGEMIREIGGRGLRSARVDQVVARSSPEGRDSAWTDVAVALIRPDGYVAHASSSVEGITDAVAAWTLPALSR